MCLMNKLRNLAVRGLIMCEVVGLCEECLLGASQFFQKTCVSMNACLKKKNKKRGKLLNSAYCFIEKK